MKLALRLLVASLLLLPGCATACLVDALADPDPAPEGRVLTSTRAGQVALVPFAVAFDAATLPVQVPILIGLKVWLASASWSF